jgi:predicted phage terminase large subunit-like protein
MDLPDDLDLSQFTTSEQLLIKEYIRRKKVMSVANSFLDYIQYMFPWFIIEEVHIAIAEKLQLVADGKLSRLMLAIAPRAGKSQMASVFFPTYYIGKFPDRQIMQVGHSSSMSEGFGRDARNVILTEEYREIFPDTQLAKDSRSVSSWATTRNGKYNTAGVTSGIAGKGWSLGILDDTLNEQTAKSKASRDEVYNWYGPGFLTRQMPRDPVTGTASAIINIATRWTTNNLIGRLLAKAESDPDADQWDILSIPAILDAESAALLTKISHDPKYRKYLSGPPITFAAGDSFSPRRRPLKDLEQVKASLTRKEWSALYQQQPYTEGGGIIKSSMWRKWPDKDKPPAVDYVIQVYDTAFEESEVNDYSARTTWGIFRRPEDGVASAILLERYKGRPSFPDLREEALRSYYEYHPDRVLIEKKASGHSLIQELRRNKVPISPIRVRDSKTARANVASLPFEKGCVYYMDRQWAREVIEECAMFPDGEHDDVFDTVVHAMLFLRKIYTLQLSDEEDVDDNERGDQMRKYARRTAFGAKEYAP